MANPSYTLTLEVLDATTAYDIIKDNARMAIDLGLRYNITVVVTNMVDEATKAEYVRLCQAHNAKRPNDRIFMRM